MLHRTPAEIRIGRQALTLLHRVLDAAAPEEGCALLLGRRMAASQGAAPAAEPLWHLSRLWPCRNGWEPEAERRSRFAIDPREQLHAQKWARQRGLELLGAVHSHPGGEPVPSATDRALAVPPALMLIRGAPVAQHGPPPLRCWWLEENADPRLLPWRMED